MKRVSISFELFEFNVEDLYPVYEQVSCYIIFDVKMRDNSCCKFKMVAGGHKTTTSSLINYYSVVYLYSVSIDLTISAFNDLKVLE